MREIKHFRIFVILWFSVLDVINCHVVLTYPPARKYAFDFLDNVHSRGPCGVPKGLGKVTNFIVGERINVTWHMAFIHIGGYRLSLLNSREETIHEFHNRFIDLQNPTQQSSEITLPNQPCFNCTLQLLRQAEGWTTQCPPGQYVLWSCADINIHTVEKFGIIRCGKHPMKNGKCMCRAPYSGDRCQYKDECQFDSDCNRGKCIPTESTNFPKKQCYCFPGWFGSNCQKRSSVTGFDVDYRRYVKTVLSPEYQLYHRPLKESMEIEMVMRVRSQTWVGLGWRPSDFRSGCQHYPVLPRYDGAPEPEGEVEPEGEGKPEGTATPEGEGEPEGTATPEGEGEPEGTATPEGEGEPEVTANPGGEDEPEVPTKPEGDVEPDDTPEPKGEAKPEGNAEPKGEGNPEPDGNAEPEGEGNPESTVEPQGEGEPEGEGETCGPPRDTNETIGDMPHPMDCIDMVIGSAKGNLSRVGDYYSRDRSSPQKDEMFGGQNDLTGAVGFEDENGFTTIIFRKRIVTHERTDHRIIDGPMHVIWARGQDQGKYLPDYQSGLDDPTARPSDPNFYKVDELKYHGYAYHRGVTSVNFMTEPEETVDTECRSDWVNPDDPSHRISWMYNSITDRVHFVLKANLAVRQWIGVGFSNDKSMLHTDTIVAWIDEGVVNTVDGWTTGYSMPQTDSQQDVTGATGSVTNGLTTISFHRARDTRDRSDIRFSGTDCVYMIFAKGGQYMEGTKSYTKHNLRPSVSEARICIPCPKGTASTPQPITTPIKFERFWIVIRFRVIGIPWTNKYKDSRSREYKELKQDLELSLKLTFNRLRGFVTVTVLGFRPGSVRVEAAVEIQHSKTETKKNLKSVFNEMIVSGKLGGHLLDKTSNTYSVGDPEAVRVVTTAPPPRDEDEVPEAVWIIIGVAAGGVFIILLLGVCNCVRMKNQKRKKYEDEVHKSLSLNSTNSSSNGNGYTNGKNGLAVMNMTYEDWREHNEANRVPSFKTQQKDLKITDHSGEMESFSMRL